MVRWRGLRWRNDSISGGWAVGGCIRTTVNGWSAANCGRNSGAIKGLEGARAAAMSIFRIPSMASKVRLAAVRSGSAITDVVARSVICHDRPHLSLHKPHAISRPPFPTIASHKRSVSLWKSVAPWQMKSSLCLDSGPRFRPRLDSHNPKFDR